MKKILCLFLCMFLFTIPCQSATIETSIKVHTSTSLNVRTQPNISSQIIKTLSPNFELICYYSKESDWSKIFIDNQIGYVNNNYLIEKTSNMKIKDFLNQNIDNNIQQKQNDVERLYEPSDFKIMGVLNYDGWRWTWYTSRILPGQGLYLPGRNTNSDGYICDGDGYICIASVDLAQGTIIKTPLGYYGKVYDTGCPHGVLDVYTNW